MGKLIVPRHTADLEYILPAMKVYYDAADWVSLADYKDRLVAALLASGKEKARKTDETHYTKCSEVPRYFGFLERCEPGKDSSDVRITPSGRAFYEAVDSGDETAAHAVLMDALEHEHVTFGRGNEGCGSDTCYEAPAIVIKSAMLLQGVSNKEMAFILGELVEDDADLASTLLWVKYARTMRLDNLQPRFTADIKFIPFLKRLHFFADTSDKKTVVADAVMRKYYQRLAQLPIRNDVAPTAPSITAAYQGETVQKIYYGSPGSGKSYRIKNDDQLQAAEAQQRVTRTTFHPETDYASFVGSYKPQAYVEGGLKKITYEFVPQAFTEAYVEAWSQPADAYYLVIEEINRGNCAQIFGDLFQLLDRDDDGYSEYPVNADHDLRDYLESKLGSGSRGIKDGKLCLPPNLCLVASMNTSDQSLFPMDTAFKRRWSWEYIPIDYDNETSALFAVSIGDKRYGWHDFLRRVNQRIKRVTSSEDKQMGNFFVKHSVEEREFTDKVMFYLWSEVGKDNYQTRYAVFVSKSADGETCEFSFNELFTDAGVGLLQGFMRSLEVEELSA